MAGTGKQGEAREPSLLYELLYLIPAVARMNSFVHFYEVAGLSTKAQQFLHKKLWREAGPALVFPHANMEHDPIRSDQIESGHALFILYFRVLTL